MAYYPTFQPYPYQDQLNQLRTANPMTAQMPMQGFQQPISAQPMQLPRQDFNGLNWVQGEAGAKSWFVNPGATVLLMDSENQRFYLKSADMSGIPSLRTFEYSEIGAAPPQPKTEYVTREEFDRFVQAMTTKEVTHE